MKKKRHIKWERIFSVILIAFIIWVIISYFDIMMHNTTTCVYQNWNLFEMLWRGVFKC